MDSTEPLVTSLVEFGPVPPAFQGAEHPEADWDAIRDEFTTLYHHKGKTLKQAAIALRARRGFIAK
jgi:hypothetical protein